MLKVKDCQYLGGTQQKVIFPPDMSSQLEELCVSKWLFEQKGTFTASILILTGSLSTGVESSALYPCTNSTQYDFVKKMAQVGGHRRKRNNAPSVKFQCFISSRQTSDKKTDTGLHLAVNVSCFLGGGGNSLQQANPT